jgi:beta-lactamase regulating signal transducer with metallopeptidase domain/HEAT repeat protein
MTFVETLGWVLLHFAWQGAVAAFLLWMALLLTPSGRASLRYAIGCAALLVMVMAPVVTAMRLTASHAEPIAVQPHQNGAAANVDAIDRALEARHREAATAAPSVGVESMRWMTARSVVDDVNAALPWLVATWAVGVLLLSVRLLGGWWRTRSLRTQGLSPVPSWCADIIARLTTRLGINRPISFAVSLSAPVPMVIGHLKPLVLLPVAALSGLSPQQLEAILAHELAHVRRHDYLVNLIQTVIETLLFYHPAVWWVSGQLRVLREHCCDDLAVAACGDRKSYVHALLSLEHLRGDSPLLALGATDGPLFARARRVLIETDRTAASPRLAAAVVALAVSVLAIAGVSTASQEPARSQAPNPIVQTQSPVPVIAAPQQSGSLAERWAASVRDAGNRRLSRYWVGYSIRPVPGLPPVVYMDRNLQMLGSGWNRALPGRPLDLRTTELSAIKVLFAVDANGGAPRLTRVHVSTVPLPIDLAGLPVFWLGDADTVPSLEHVDGLYARASTADLKKDLVDVVSLHDDSPRVVAWLERRLAGSDADDIRADAAEGLARHPIQASLRALDRTARADRSTRVREEAAEALGDLKMPEGTTTLIDLVGTLDNIEVRREAVEALGAREVQPDAAGTQSDAVGALARVVTDDRDRGVQREAIEALGDTLDPRALEHLRKLAQTHADAELRREAMETLAEHLSASDAIAALRHAIESDHDVDVKRDAVERLAEVADARARDALVEVARSHKDVEVRAEAVQSLADALAAVDTAKILADIVRQDVEERVRKEAVEALADLTDGQGIAALIEIARSHAEADIRKEALESLLESDHPEARKLFERALEPR